MEKEEKEMTKDNFEIISDFQDILSKGDEISKIFQNTPTN